MGIDVWVEFPFPVVAGFPSEPEVVAFLLVLCDVDMVNVFSVVIVLISVTEAPSGAGVVELLLFSHPVPIVELFVIVDAGLEMEILSGIV